MKKLLLTTVIMTFAAAGVMGQSVIDNPANSSYFGIRASGDLTCPGKVEFKNPINLKDEYFKHGGGFSVGAVYNIPVVANLYVEPGVSFYYNATGYSDIIEQISVGDISLMKHASVRQTGFRVPVMIGYHFDFTPEVSLAVYTGPELDIGVSSDSYLTSNTGYHESASDYGDNYLGFKHNRVDCSWKFGVGFNLARNYYIGIGGAVGMCDMAESDNISFHQNRVEFTLGYNF